MTNASRDENSVPTLIALDSSNGSTVMRVQADPAKHTLLTLNGTGGSDFGPLAAGRDENSVPTLLAVSSSDGVTPIPIYAENGRLLINSN